MSFLIARSKFHSRASKRSVRWTTQAGLDAVTLFRQMFTGSFQTGVCRADSAARKLRRPAVLAAVRAAILVQAAGGRRQAAGGCHASAAMAATMVVPYQVVEDGCW